MRGVAIDFGHLACCTSLDVLGDEGFHVWPPVVGSN